MRHLLFMLKASRFAFWSSLACPDLKACSYLTLHPTNLYSLSIRCWNDYNILYCHIIIFLLGFVHGESESRSPSFCIFQICTSLRSWVYIIVDQPEITLNFRRRCIIKQREKRLTSHSPYSLNENYHNNSLFIASTYRQRMRCFIFFRSTESNSFIVSDDGLFF